MWTGRTLIQSSRALRLEPLQRLGQQNNYHVLLGFGKLQSRRNATRNDNKNTQVDGKICKSLVLLTNQFMVRGLLNSTISSTEFTGLVRKVKNDGLKHVQHF
jgi:hypothetical protein